MKLHSEIETYRRVLRFHTPAGVAVTVIVLRRNSTVWLTFNGAEKTTVVMNDAEAGQLIEAVCSASGGLQCVREDVRDGAGELPAGRRVPPR